MPLFDNIVKPDDLDKQAQTPIPLEALRMGFASQEAFQEKNLQESKDATSNFFNLPAFGQDAQVLSQAKQAFLDATKGVSTTNFADPQTASKINGIISQITSNPDVQAAVSRGTTYQRMQKEKEKAEAAGKEYINPGWDDAQSYYNSGKYIRNKQFNSDGFIAPDVAKGMSEALKDAVDTKRVYDPTTGEYVLTESMNKDKAGLVVRNYLANTPNAMKTFNYNLDKQLSSTDWDHAAKDRIVDDYNKNEELIANATTRLHTSTDPTERQILTDELNQHLGYRAKLAKINSLQGTGEMVKSQYKDYLQNKQLNDYVEAYTHFKEGKGELAERTKLAIEHSNKLIEENNVQAQENYRKQLELSGQEGQLINDNGKLRVATSDEIASGKALPATKSNALHIGGNPLAGDVKLEEIDKAVSSRKADYIQQLVENSKLKSKNGLEYNKVEITPEGKIKLSNDQISKTKPDITELTSSQLASMIVGKDTKSQTMVTQHYKQKETNESKIGEGYVYQRITPTTKVIRTPSGGSFNVQRNVTLPDGKVLPAIPIVPLGQLDKIDPGHYYVRQEDNTIRIKK